MLIHCCIGIMAYNEAANIGRVLDALLHQKTEVAQIDRIVVVCSGCTDATEEIVHEFMQKDARIHLLTQNRRYGKASAVNLFLKSFRSEVIILESADTVPVETAIEALITPFLNPDVGIVGGHPVPVNKPDTFMGFGVNLLWDLHHRISLIRPKMGELIAFRHIFYQIPYDTAVDEASIEPLIIGQGMRPAYAAGAVVYNKGPETVRDFIKQRRRIYSGHLYVKDMLGYKVSTMNGYQITRLYLQALKPDWRYFIWAPLIAVLEIYVRLLGMYDYYVIKSNPFQWPMVESTKEVRAR